jgi:hypothetical protein
MERLFIERCVTCHPSEQYMNSAATTGVFVALAIRSPEWQERRLRKSNRRAAVRQRKPDDLWKNYCATVG